MKFIKINNKDYVIKFTSKVISELHSRNITITTLSEDLKIMKTNNLYITFFYGLTSMQRDITIDEVYNIIDEYFAEDEERTIEDFFLLILEELCKAMGLSKIFKEMQKEQENEKKRLLEKQKVIDVEVTKVKN